MGTHLVPRTTPATSIHGPTPHAHRSAPGPTSARFADLLGARDPLGSPPAETRPTAPTRLAAARAAPSPEPAQSGPDPLLETGRRWLSRVARGERELDRTVREAAAGGPVAPADLLAIQAQVYRHTQQVELFSKLVDRASSGVKTVLQQGG
jgi:hypothetical protein